MPGLHFRRARAGRARAIALWVTLFSLLGCDGGSSEGVDGSADGPSDRPEPLRIEVPTVPVESGQEYTDQCFSWTLGNEETIYVNEVQMDATPGVHHSNWFFVTDNTYRGPDGLWDCSERGFDTVTSALSGGVLFAQSTQATDETQKFEPGAALPLPPRSRIVADVHLLNTSPEDVDAEIALDLHALPEEEVTTPLTGFAVEYVDLEIAPRSRSEFTVTCNLDDPHRDALRRPLDFNVHYVLPHYHELGDLLRLEVVGGPNDGEVLWETRSSIGEPLGGNVDPPFDLTGAEGLRLTCGFDNPRDEEIGWGVGTQEMCIAFGFTDSERIWGAGVLERGPNEVVSQEGSTVYNEAPCTVVSYRAKHAR